jgi:uncharacterized protein
MTEPKVIKRFIAGAVCPRCAEMDKLVMYRGQNGQQVRECVRCGYQGLMTDDGPAEVETRVNQPRLGESALAHEDEIQIVNFVDAGVKRRDH